MQWANEDMVAVVENTQVTLREEGGGEEEEEDNEVGVRSEKRRNSDE